MDAQTLTPHQAAAELGLTVRQVLQLIEDGELRSHLEQAGDGQPRRMVIDRGLVEAYRAHA